MLTVENLSVRYLGQRGYALREISLNCPLVGITALVGPSGVGKSTLMAMMAGIYLEGDSLLGEFSGNVLVRGKRPDAIRGPEMISWVPQTHSLLDHLSVMGNILLPLTLLGNEQNALNKVDTLLHDLELDACRGLRPKELSGGQRTRVSLARALISDPEYLYLDEPFVGLDLKSRWGIYRLLRRVRCREGLVTVITTHNIPEAVLLSDRIVLVKDDGGRTLARVDERQQGSFPDETNSLSCLAHAREIAAGFEAEAFFVLERSSMQ